MITKIGRKFIVEGEIYGYSNKGRTFGVEAPDRAFSTDPPPSAQDAAEL